MSTDPKEPAAPPPTASAKRPATADDTGAAVRKPRAAAPEPRPALDERRLKFEDVAAGARLYEPAELVEMLRDGRAIVRGNAALALAAIGHAAPEMVPILRDSEAAASHPVAEALVRLGAQARPLVPAIAQALGGATPDVVDTTVGALARLIGAADDELTAALDVPTDLAMKTVIAAAGRVGRQGVAFLIKAAHHERIRIRMNAVAGLGYLGKTDMDASLGFLGQLETTDPVPDVRAATKQAMLQIVAREKVAAVDALPKNIPDFEERKLSASELAEYANVIDVDGMVVGLQDGRNHVKINACRALAVKGEAGARAARSMGLLCKDSHPQVRREAAKALGKLGPGAVEAAPDLIVALGDAEEDVAEAAFETFVALGAAARDALVKGLETGSVEGGRRVAALLARLPGAAATLTEAFASPAVNVQVNAAHGLGLLGTKAGEAGIRALEGARTGGDVRTREAVRAALDMIFPPTAKGPKPVAIEGFEDRVLAAAELDKAKAALEKLGVGDLIMYLEDGRDQVRANAATGLGVLGPAAQPAALTLGVRLKDDAPRVRIAAAQALDRIGDAAVLETADYLVGALGDADAKVAEACAAVIKARKARMIGALVRGLETDKPDHGPRIAALINVFEDAAEILCDAIESPAVNVQVNAAIGLGMLGKGRVTTKGRRALEERRTGGWARTNEAAFKALEMLDGPKKTGPDRVEVDGFETRPLGHDAFAAAAGKLRLDDLVTYCADGRAVVRGNAATALGALGAAAVGAARPLGVLCRDDDHQVRIAAASALDRIGDDAVKEAAEFLVSALRGDAEVAKVAAQVLAARKARVLGALLKGLETDDDTHGRRILEVINALPDALEILCDAIESPAENVQYNAAIGIGMLGAKRAGTEGRKRLEGRRTGGFVRVREAAFKGLAMLDAR
jgi:HEAT repeat protein